MEKATADKDFSRQIDIERSILKEHITANMDHLITPLLKKLRGLVTPQAKAYLDLLEKNLHELTSPFGYSLLHVLQGLTPREIKICGLIRDGLSNKEVADFLHISPLTVHTHRNAIRKKLGLAKSRKSLFSYLKAQSF